MTRPSQTDDAGALVELEASAHAEVVLPADAHVIGEPVTVTQIRYPGLSHPYLSGDVSVVRIDAPVQRGARNSRGDRGAEMTALPGESRGRLLDQRAVEH